jgi:hypothetical protein
MNTTLGTGDVQLSEGFLAWRKWVSEDLDLGVRRLLKLTCPHLSEQKCEAYDTPFPDIRYKANVRGFPKIDQKFQPQSKNQC